MRRPSRRNANCLAKRNCGSQRGAVRRGESFGAIPFNSIRNDSFSFVQRRPHCSASAAWRRTPAHGQHDDNPANSSGSVVRDCARSSRRVIACWARPRSTSRCA